MKWTAPQILGPQSAASAGLMLIAGAGGSVKCLGSTQHAERVIGMLSRIDFAAEAGQSLDLLPLDERMPRLLVLVVGTARDHWLASGGYLIEAMRRHRLSTVRLPDATALGGCEALEAMLLGALLHGFEPDKAARSNQDFTPTGLIVADRDRACAEAACRCANAVNRARAWVERPANLLTPSVWIEEAREVFAPLGARVRVLGPKELEAEGAGALLAVGRGSEQGAHLLIVEWRGDASRAQWDAVMAGKGLTFDTGGLNLKPRPNLSKMKLDMAGGAAVLGALELAIARRSRANVVAIVPIAENAIDALSYRPGDVITSMAGLTIEVADTDAEGRLVLADALTYGIRKYQPTWIIDAATLTTAVTSVLHEEFAAVYASDEQLARELLAAGELVGERLWRMPLDSSQDYLIESEIADVCNVGAPGLFGRGEGSPAAGAKFLEKFAGSTPWAHIDICGTAWSTRRAARCGKGATGYGVRLLDRWLTTVEEGNDRVHIDRRG